MITYSFSKTPPESYTRISFSEESTTVVVRLSSGQKEIIIGAGKFGDVTRRKFVLLVRRIISSAKQNKIKKLHLDPAQFSFSNFKISEQDLGELLAVNFEMANFEFVKYKSEPKEGWDFVTDISFGPAFAKASAGKAKEFKAGVRRGSIVGEEVNACRALANTPGGEMTPALLADAAKKAAKGTGVGVKVLGKREMSKLRMGAILGVGEGSEHEPKFIIMEYSPYAKAAANRPVALVGKGVTFDSGGLNLKPSEHIYEMHMDMSGGAAVIHAIVLAAKLKIKRNIVALVPAVENMPSGSSYRPGDVLRSMSGKTIEILNTDAEGRVILADALTYAKKYNPALVVDAATLTGAAEVALGQKATALLTRDPMLEKKFRELGEESGDYVWPLPLWDEYEDDIKGTFGDFANTGKEGRHGGAITAAMFLYQFTKEYPEDCGWVHLDIAPRMVSVEGDHLAKGAAGAPVRLLIKLLERGADILA